LAVALGLVFILWPGSDARIVRPDATTAQKRSDARPSPRPLAADSLPINVEDMPPKLPALSWEQLLARGDENARARRWQPAAADFAAALRAHPDEHWHWFRAATILAWAQDQSAYRQHCAEMLRRFGETTDPPTAERTAKACLLVPGGVADLKPVVALADRAVAATDHEFYPFFLMARGLASYRSGEFDKALEQASKAISSDPAAIGLNVPAHLIVAMSQHRLGQADEARKSLRQARDIMGQEWFPGIDRGELGEAWWHDWLICQTLRREADGLIEGKQSKSQDSASAPPQPGRSPFE
jgi:tetratricopeptide (TPR) repeat protein